MPLEIPILSFTCTIPLNATTRTTIKWQWKPFIHESALCKWKIFLFWHSPEAENQIKVGRSTGADGRKGKARRFASRYKVELSWTLASRRAERKAERSEDVTHILTAFPPFVSLHLTLQHIHEGNFINQQVAHHTSMGAHFAGLLRLASDWWPRDPLYNDYHNPRSNWIPKSVEEAKFIDRMNR